MQHLQAHCRQMMFYVGRLMNLINLDLYFKLDEKLDFIKQVKIAAQFGNINLSIRVTTCNIT